MTISFGNFGYLLMIAILGVLSVLSVQITKRCGKRFAHLFVLVLLWCNFMMHFLKQLNPFYMANWPYSLNQSTFTNLCACYVIMAPFLYMFGGKYGRDYIYYVGIISCVAVYLYPSTALELGHELDKVENILEVFRFYMCHAPLLIVPLVMVGSDLHQLDYKRIWAIPLFFYSVMALTVLDDLIIRSIGLYEDGFVGFLTRDSRNGAFAYGPYSSLDGMIDKILWMIPSVFYKKLPGGDYFFTPVLWLVLPTYLPLCLVFLLLSLGSEGRVILLDYQAFRQKLRMWKEERKARR